MWEKNSFNTSMQSMFNPNLTIGSCFNWNDLPLPATRNPPLFKDLNRESDMLLLCIVKECICVYEMG